MEQKLTLGVGLICVLCAVGYAQEQGECQVIKNLSPQDGKWYTPDANTPTLTTEVLFTKNSGSWYGSRAVSSQNWVQFSAGKVNLEVGAQDAGTGSHAGIKFTLDPGYQDLTLTFQMKLADTTPTWGNNLTNFDATYTATVYGFDEEGNATNIGTWTLPKAEEVITAAPTSYTVTLNADSSEAYDSYGLMFDATETTSLGSGGGVSLDISNININGTPVPEEPEQPIDPEPEEPGDGGDPVDPPVDPTPEEPDPEEPEPEKPEPEPEPTPDPTPEPDPDPDQPDPGEPDQPTDPDTPQPILPPDPSDSDLLEAGSTIPTLNMAQHRAFYNRMFQMRDRGVRLGLDQEHTHTDLPYYHLWITGTGSYTDLNMQADYAGYTLSTWGGSAGADFNVNEHWSLGVALAADYGKLKATAYDEHAEADLDTYSLHFYTRYQQARWGHLFLIGGALSRATVERTMYIANDHWNTNGKTNGFGIGAMYELTYDVPLNDERSAILQPLFNLSFATTQFDAYQERLQGTDATVDIHQQTHTTGTAAVGVRYLAQTGTNLFGRAVIAELRANVAQDFGDRQARVNGELAGESFTVRSAKVGMTALQAGAGITLPVGLQNAVFLHVNGDVRSKQYSVSGTLGWRYSF